MITSSNHSSDRLTANSWSGRLIVLEGMPGAGKTTAADALASLGQAVVGEYTDEQNATVDIQAHPDTDDDDAHQRNWLRKTAQCSACLGTHPMAWADRDWLSSLSYAYSTAPGDGGDLLARRAAWAVRHLTDGTLLLPGTYVLFDLDPATSVLRRVGRLRPGHPWHRLEALDRLRAFYRRPADCLRPVNDALADALALPTTIDVSGHDDPLATLGFLVSLPWQSSSVPARGTR